MARRYSGTTAFARYAAGSRQCRLRLADQEVVLFELGALHLLAHPDRGYAAAGPKNLRILARAVFRLGLPARALFSRSFQSGNRAKHPRRLGRGKPRELRQLAFQKRALLAHLLL